MPIIFIPSTQNVHNFLSVYHPSPIRYSIRDNLGLILSGVIKQHCNYRREVKDIINRKEYPQEVCLHYSVRNHLRNQKITGRSVKIVNNKIESLIREELYLFVKIGLLKNPTTTIRMLLDQFIEIYSLTMSVEEYATLERNERRRREKNGELLYKRTKSCQSKSETSNVII